MKPHLALADAAIEPKALRVRRLMAEARLAAREQVGELETALTRAARLASEIADGGEAYPAGVRDACQRLAADVIARSQQIRAISRTASTPSAPH